MFVPRRRSLCACARRPFIDYRDGTVRRRLLRGALTRLTDGLSWASGWKQAYILPSGECAAPRPGTTVCRHRHVQQAWPIWPQCGAWVLLAWWISLRC